jgi:hypothetical protein
MWVTSSLKVGGDERVTWIVPRFSKISSALQISTVRTLDESSIHLFPVKLGIEWLLIIGFTTFANQKCVKVRSGPTEEPTNIHEAAPSRIHRDSDVLARFCRTDLARTAQPFRKENVEKHNDEKCVYLWVFQSLTTKC